MNDKGQPGPGWTVVLRRRPMSRESPRAETSHRGLLLAERR